MRQRAIKKIVELQKKWTIRELAELIQSTSPHSNTLNGDIANVLLQDVNIRLANQHNRICQMIRQMTVTKQKSNESKPKKGVVRAVNQSLHEPSLRQLMQQNQIIHECTQKASKALNDLEILHADTFSVSAKSMFQNRFM